jgi:sugar phosphate permease
MNSVKEAEKTEVISFWKAWLLPRVLLYSSALFLTKMAVYNLLLQLPTFLKTSPGFNPHYDEQQTANLSTVIDFGAMLGSIFLGKLSDFLYGKRSPVALFALIISSGVSFVIYWKVYDMSTTVLFLMFFLVGFFLSGLNNMIQGACSADLGKQEALKGNAKAISTVTGIIDGSGTMGAAVG